jgi:hypothetical protein
MRPTVGIATGPAMAEVDSSPTPFDAVDVRWSLVALAFVAGACGKGGGDSDTAATKPPTTQLIQPAAAPAAPRVQVAYPDTDAGLKQLAAELLDASRSSDQRRLAVLLESLRLRDPEGWFRAAFGQALGSQLALDYQAVSSEIGQLAPLLSRLSADLQTIITIERYVRPEMPESVGYQSAALARMQNRVPLYSVRFATLDMRKVFHLWSFVHQDGSFRYVGKMKRTVDAPPDPTRDLLELRRADADKLKAAAPPR